MALTKVTGGVVSPSSDYAINNVTGVAATFTGNVSIGGTLTYQDVSNIDAVGIITAQAGIHLGIGATSGKIDVATGISTFTKVGIGTNNPETRLHVSDGHLASANDFDSNVVLAVTKNAGASSYAGIAINSGASGGSFIHFGDTGDSNIGRILSISDGSPKFSNDLIALILI